MCLFGTFYVLIGVDFSLWLVVDGWVVFGVGWFCFGCFGCLGWVGFVWFGWVGVGCYGFGFC